MPLEIERKFLVINNSFQQNPEKKSHIIQGFLNSDKNRVVRIRTIDQQAYITIKGITSKNGTTRYEWEKEIAFSEAKELLNLCEKEPIEKFRYIIIHKNHTFEVDVFLGINEGLIVAEIELESENDEFEKPEWLGKEVTGIKKYYNSELSNTPYKTW
ncbi:CYTH domain-containing protein [Flavicella marina]|uniref:CYTH domain-containing protein n=1 Tax=Flavicella marina TaxID=1475951 RepID=UPI001264728D|nr:CYTH domain-containing protein [Flavicella marina]